MASSTTSKITKAMAAAILAFCQQAGQGVIVRRAGQEVGYTADDTENVLAQCTIPKATLDQIGYVPSTPSPKVFSVRYTSVHTLVKLAGELHNAYAALTAFDNECKAIEAKSAVVRSDFRVWKHKREQLTSEQHRVTERLALAIERSTQERFDEACRAVGSIGYVFDGF